MIAGGNIRQIVIGLGLAGLLLLEGCSKEEFVREAKDGLWTTLYVVVGIVCLLLIAAAWFKNNTLGVVVTALVIIGLGCLYYFTRYSEPAAEQPHGRIVFLAETKHGFYTVRIDGRNIGLAGKMERFHSGWHSGTGDGEYRVRVPPGA